MAPHRRGQQAGLDRERIVASALSLLDTEGPEALTMRRLGRELGVAAMSLYEYFPNKQALLDAVVDSAAGEIELPPAHGPWRERMIELASALLDTLERHPGGIMVRRSRPILNPAAMRTAERAMAILTQAGLAPDIAARTYRAIFLLTFAHATFTTGGRTQDYAATIASLPRDEFPAATAAANELAATMTGREQFVWTIEQILDGVDPAA